MDTWQEVSLEMTRWLQANYPQLKDFFRFISFFGQFEFFLILVPLLYWSVHKKVGKHLTYLLVISLSLNTIFKHAIRAPRPFWLDASLKLAEETSYGIPSGHAQIATTMYPYFAFWLRRSWVWLLAIGGVLLMSLSRIYLGVHFLHDILGGQLLGLLILGGYFLWRRYFEERFHNRILGQRLLLVILVPIGLALIYVAMQLAIGQPNLQLSWADFIPLAELTSVEDMATAVGIMLGVGIGFVFESGRLSFVVDGPWSTRIVRYLLGLFVTVLIWRGLGAIFPADPLWLAIPLRIFRYFLAGLWVAYYGPLVFVRLGLAQQAPEPEVKYTVNPSSIMKG